jgi:ABC-type proline/glycine betaine transport system permease subunit
MAKNVPATDVLRLICLQSLVSNGLKQKEIETLKRHFLQVFISLQFSLTLGIWLRISNHIR